MFCASQPIVLNATVTPTAVSPVEVEASTVASIAEVFFESNVRSTAVISLLVMYALALLKKTFVEIVPLTAIDLPSPNALPPEEDTLLSVFACSFSSSEAVSVILPPALTVVLLIKAATLLLT